MQSTPVFSPRAAGGIALAVLVTGAAGFHTPLIPWGRGQEGNPTLIFSDDFESGKRNSGSGGKWSATGKRVSVQAGGAEGSKFALDFLFPARDTGRMSTAEQRFTLTKRVTDLWIDYDFFLPANFYHREGKQSSNNKFLALWEEQYQARNGVPLIVFEFRPMNEGKRREGQPGDAYLYVHALDRAGKMRNRGRRAPNAFSANQRGRWNQVKVHVRLSSSDAAADGLIELWLNGERVINADRLDLPSREQHYLRKGYFMGWSNSGYSADTHFKIDNVRFSSGAAH